MNFTDDITLTLAPGICNSSESVYIRRVVYHAQFNGYRVAVLNHVGALKCVPLTSPRIFNYGKIIIGKLRAMIPKCFQALKTKLKNIYNQFFRKHYRL